MSVKELCQKYNRPHPSQAINAAIRAEIPGGGIVLDLLNSTYPMAQKNPKQFQAFFESIQNARNEMAKSIALKYELKTATGEFHDEKTAEHTY